MGGTRRGAPRQTDCLFDLLTHRFQRDVKLGDRPGRHAITFVDKSEQDVFGPDEAVVQESRFLLSQDQYPTGTIGKTLEHAPSLSLWRLGCSRCR